MEEKIEIWEREYQLKNLKIIGYRGGYPMIQFDKEENMCVVRMSEEQINKVVRNAETYGGIRLGVAYNLRKTAFLRMNDETVVICGHEYVIDIILEKLF